MNMDEQLLTSAEVRARLKVTRQTVWRLEKSGALNPIKVGTVKRFRQSEVDGNKKIK
jgi:excisionase family DNA binding protein